MSLAVNAVATATSLKFVIVTDERIFLVKSNDQVVIYYFIADNSDQKSREK